MSEQATKWEENQGKWELFIKDSFDGPWQKAGYTVEATWAGYWAIAPDGKKISHRSLAYQARGDAEVHYGESQIVKGVR